jgi:hypothetical protein
MTELVKRFLGAVVVTDVAPTQGALVVVPPPPPTLPELGERIRQAQAEIEGAAITVVAKAIEIGKALRTAKTIVGHGNFEDYCAIECRLPMRTAQNYMRLARYEPQLEQLVRGKNAGLAHLTMADAFKLIEKLRPKRR